MRIEGEMLSMARLTGAHIEIVPTQNLQQRGQRREVLLGDADYGAIDQAQLDPRTRSHASYRQLQKIDPVAAQRIHSNDAKRIIRALEVYELTGKPISNFQRQWNQGNSESRITNNESRTTKSDWTIIGLRREKTEESKRINARVKKMLDAGLADEVRLLLAEEKPLSKQAACAIGYAEIIDYLAGKISLEDAIELIKKNTRYLAKHQRTWFRSFGNIKWLDVAPDEPFESVLSRAITIIRGA